MTVRQWVRITPECVVISGEPLATQTSGAAMLTEVYRSRIGDYPKFYKMDELTKLGFLAAELLLQADGVQPSDEDTAAHGEGEDRAIMLFGRSGSVCNDRKYQQTIDDVDNYFPSPAIFVYTLPNIVTGEIAIRNHYHGETAFYLLPRRNETVIRQMTEALLCDGAACSVISGWVDYESDNQFEACLELCIKE